MIELDLFLTKKEIKYEKTELDSSRIFQPTGKYVCRCDSYKLKMEIVTYPIGSIAVNICDCICLYEGHFNNLAEEIILKFFEEETLDICKRSIDISSSEWKPALLFVLSLIYRGKTKPALNYKYVWYDDLDPVLERRLRIIAEDPPYIEYDYGRITHKGD